MVNDGVTRSAILSPCGDYRYNLLREWGTGPRLGVVMLNPSTADEAIDDPTIRKVVGFATLLGYGSIEVVNLFALRATNPETLWTVRDPVGRGNDAAIAGMVGRSVRVLVAWGGHKDRHRSRDARVGIVTRLLEAERATAFVLGRCADGSPRHPLYLRYDVVKRLGEDARPPQDGFI